ncbi:MAG: hypothetical protein KDD50_12860 [Bdellovibrionales bacterium]|nr:hypothetical protein [Bdellovibrionales bacterium]
MKKIIVIYIALTLLLSSCLESKNNKSAESNSSAGTTKKQDRSLAAKKYSLSKEGYGPVKIGMSIQQASKALGIELKSPNPEQDEPYCFYVYPNGDYKDIGFMVTEQKISRIEIRKGDNANSSNIKTKEGIGIGSTTEEVKLAYRDLSIDPHPYSPPNAKYLIFKKGQEFQIIFETDDQGVVEAVRVGKKPEVQYIEGCA